MKISKDEWADIRNMLVGMSKGLQGDGQRNRQNCIVGGAISTTTFFKCICNHWFFWLGTINK